MLVKTKPYRSKKLLAAAAGRSCIRCGCDDGTVISAHYTGFRQHSYGKGAGIKCSDLACAWFCATCHAHFDQPQEYKSVDLSEEFLHCIVLTLIKAAEDGVIG